MQLASQTGDGTWRAPQAMSQIVICILDLGKPLESFKQDSDMIIYTSLHIIFWISGQIRSALKCSRY
jgi:hypothetical protein